VNQPSSCESTAVCARFHLLAIPASGPQQCGRMRSWRAGTAPPRNAARTATTPALSIILCYLPLFVYCNPAHQPDLNVNRLCECDLLDCLTPRDTWRKCGASVPVLTLCVVWTVLSIMSMSINIYYVYVCACATTNNVHIYLHAAAATCGACTCVMRDA
jgi:hypothetical protein